MLLPVEYFARHSEISTRDKRRIVISIFGTVAAAAAGWGMASAVDSGTTRAWAPAAQIAWGITLIAAVFAAVFLYAQAVALVRGTELPFLPDPTESPTRRRAFRWMVIIGVALLIVVFLLGATATSRARLAMASIGVFSIRSRCSAQAASGTLQSCEAGGRHLATWL